LFRALNQLLLKSEEAAPGEVLDLDFIRKYTTGYDRFTQDVLNTSWPEVEEATGLSAKEINLAHTFVLNSERIIVCWAMGLTQHRNSVATLREIVNFLLLRGNIGKPGAGVCPVRGHSNVQGDRTMGICEKPPPWLDRLGDVFGFNPP